MPVNNVTASMNQASAYLSDYATTTDSARKSPKVDAREFVTYWNMLTAGSMTTTGLPMSVRSKMVAKLKEDMAGVEMTKGAKELYDEVIDYGGSRVLRHAAPRYNSGGGV